MNLLPEPYQARLSTRRAKRVWSAALVLSALVAGGTVAYGQLQSGPADSGRFAEQVSLADRRAEESKLEALELGSRLAQNRHALSAIDAVAGQPDWQALLHRISQALGDQALLTSCRFGPVTQPAIQQAVGTDAAEPGSVWLVLEGVVDSYPEVPALLLRLEEMGLFQHVLLVETRSQPFGDKARIGFRVACRAE